MTSSSLFYIATLIGFGFSIYYGQKAKKKVEKYPIRKEVQQDNPYHTLRSMALNMTPSDLGLIIPENSDFVYGIVADMYMSNGIATVVVFSTGDTSIYLSNGSGFIGAGQHRKVAQIAKEFVQLAANYYQKGISFEEATLPETGNTNFYILSAQGKRRIKEKTSLMENGSSAYTKLFEELNKVITAVRLQSEHK